MPICVHLRNHVEINSLLKLKDISPVSKYDSISAKKIAELSSELCYTIVSAVMAGTYPTLNQ